MEARTFSGCTSLTSITIPASLTSIEGEVFKDCTSLATMNFGGTKAQWSSVSKGYNWKENLLATVIHCSDGDAAL